MNLHFALLRNELEAALAGLDEQQTQLRPAGNSERWNIQQIVGHLTLTYAATTEAMNARIAKGSATRAKPSMAQRAGQFALIRIGYFPQGRKAPDRVKPPVEDPVSSSLLIARITDGLLNMDRRSTAAEAMFGCKQRTVSHMVLGPLSIDQWRRFHLVHGRHHIKQIQGIRSEHNV